MIAIVLMTLSAGITLLLGTAHLVFTFRGPKFLPRDAALQARMAEVSPVISKDTSMWRCWLGFNASHSLGVMLFGLIYGFLALAHGTLLFQSVFLLLVGFAMLAGLWLLAKAYWFSVPFTGVSVALACYLGSIAVALSG